jgi:opacity protein-like surface antigen
MAFAADLPIAAPAYAPVEFGGWYLRGDIGFSNQFVNNIRKNDPAGYASLSSFDETTGFDTGGIFGIGGGYQFNNWFRVDVTGQYRGKANFKGTDLFTFPFAGAVASGIDNYSASKSELLFLANAYVDLGTWWYVTPFIGAGVGTSRITISNFTDTGANNAQPAPVAFVGGPPITSFAAASSGSKWNFAWAAHAGLAYHVTPNVTVELAYSYVSLGSGTTGVITTFDGFSANHVFKFNNITSNDLTLGVRWSLEPAPVYAPPLITKG